MKFLKKIMFVLVAMSVVGTYVGATQLNTSAEVQKHCCCGCGSCCH